MRARACKQDRLLSLVDMAVSVIEVTCDSADALPDSYTADDRDSWTRAMKEMLAEAQDLKKATALMFNEHAGIDFAAAEKEIGAGLQKIKAQYRDLKPKG